MITLIGAKQTTKSREFNRHCEEVQSTDEAIHTESSF